MTKKNMPRDEEFVFAPLGGVGEIGMNFSIYGFGPEHDRHWIAVDCGVAFAGPDLPGIDLIMPDLRFIAGEKKRLLGLIITHGHEDHIGAVADLWPRLQCPVYATPFTAALMEARRLSEPGAPKISLNVVPAGGQIKLGPFTIDLINVAHSIPESQSLAITTPLGTVIHTGDWKIDPTPVLGLPTDEAKFRSFGDKGVLALIGDSTNAVREGVSPSEKDVAAELTKIIAAAKGRIGVTTFASNVSRIRSVAEAAMANDRQVVIVGRAMDRVVNIAREQGMLEGLPPFVGPSQYGYLPRDKVVVLLTGSQGEPRAALNRVVRDEHPEITFDSGDTVIFSSRTIPGNEKAVGDIINGLVRQGLNIVTDRDGLVHVSGHPRRGEMRELFGWVRPKASVPVHGEALHLSEHAKLARECGVKEVLTISNGETVRLAPGPAEIVDVLPFGRLYKDGNFIVSDEDHTIGDRRKLAFAGIVSVAVAMSHKGEVVGEVVIDLSGIPEATQKGESVFQIVSDAVMDTLDSLTKARRRDPDAVGESVQRAVRGTLNGVWGKKPTCHVLIVPV
jgi:ribonuclease J